MPVKLLLAGMAGLMLATPRRRTEGPAAVVAAHADHLAMKAAPINSDWIIRGTPLARIGEHSTSTDQASSTAVWDCTAGEFRWYFNWDETVVIQEGEVHVTDADGEVRLLRAGDIAYFRGGHLGHLAHRQLRPQDRLPAQTLPRSARHAVPAAQCAASGQVLGPLR